MHERICTSCSGRVRWCTMMFTTPVKVTHLRMHGYNNCQKSMHTLRKQRICTRACAPMQRCRSYFAMKAIANLSRVLREHRTGCRLPPALLPVRQNQWPDAVRSRNSSKSTLAHDAVAAALSRKHHSIIRVGAGLIQFVYFFALALGCRPHPRQSFIFAIVFAGIPTYYKTHYKTFLQHPKYK